MPKALLYIQTQLTSMIISINVLHNKHNKKTKNLQAKLFKRVRLFYIFNPPMFLNWITSR